MDAVVLRHVTKRFRHCYAVNDLSFEVRRGSVFGLLGPNGSGKTTTIRMIVDILAPDSGEILILGEQTSRRMKRSIGYLPEERGLFKDMKIGDLLLFFATIKGIDNREAARRIDDWLAKLHLSEWKDKKPGELSKGMAQKIQFIIAVLHEPALLILDEPFSGFDPVSVQMVENIILDLKQRGMTIIFSTHQMEQAELMCEEICLMSNSRKVLGGNLGEIKRGFGSNTVILDYKGTDTFLDNGIVKNVERYPHHIKVRLKEGADGHELLERALAAGARVNRFEVIDTSLRDIFIATVEAAT
jgi:ABC-2 type transport system ATP-binding protein